MFVEIDQPLQLNGNQPVALHAPETAWRIDGGSVDVFVQPVRGGRLAAHARRLFRAESGQALFGIDRDPNADGLLLFARATPGTQLVEVQLASIRAAAADPIERSQVCGWLDAWVNNLSAGVVGAAPPRMTLALRADTTHDLADQRAARPSKGVLWVRHLAGKSTFAGYQSAQVGAAMLFPLAESAWLQADGPVQLRAIETSAIIHDRQVWASVHAFNQTMLAALAEKLGHEELAERERRERAEELGRQVLRGSLRQIATVLAPVPAEPVVAHLPHEELLAACRIVAAAAGVAIQTPRGQQFGASARDPVIAIARASQLRLRRVSLRRQWWRDDNGPLLAFTESAHRPVALIPSGVGRYDMHDPATGERARVTMDIAASLEPFAYAFFRPLPERPLTMWGLLGFGLRGSRRDLGWLLGAGALVGVLGIVPPLITQVIVDTHIPAGAGGEALLLSAVLLAVAVAVALFQVARNIAAARIETRMSVTIQSGLWDRLLKLPVPFFRQYSAGGLATRAMGIETVRQFLAGLTVPVLLPGIFSIFNLLLLFGYDVILALIALALTLVAAGVTLLAGWHAFRYERAVQELLPNLAGLVVQLVQSIPKLRIAGAEPRAFGVWAHKFAALQRAVLKVRQITRVVAVFSFAFPLWSTMALFVVVAARGGGQAYSTGTFLAFSAAFNSMLGAMLAISINFYKLARVGALLAQQRPLLEATPEVDRLRLDPGELSGAIEISRVTFRYSPDGPDILHDVSISVRPGQLIAIVGPSGSGKSTLTRLMLGFEVPQTGAIYYDGQSLAELDLSFVRRQIGVVLQNDKLMPGSIADNIVGLSLLTAEDAWEAAEMVGLGDDIRALPLGMQTVVSEADSTFSGGQQQRLMLARAVVARPRILIFDEATSALDNRTQEVVTRSLGQLRATRIVIAHRLSTIVQADHIYVVVAGRVVQQGTYTELMREEGAFRELARRQQLDV
jgi:NHLM bacteriocin system ABC transporter ATP-binding protein